MMNKFEMSNMGLM